MVSFWYILQNLKVYNCGIKLDNFHIFGLSFMDVINYPCSKCGTMIQEHFKIDTITTPLGDKVDITKERLCYKCDIRKHDNTTCPFYWEPLLYSCDLFKFFSCRYINNFGKCPVITNIIGKK